MLCGVHEHDEHGEDEVHDTHCLDITTALKYGEIKTRKRRKRQINSDIISHRESTSKKNRRSGATFRYFLSYGFDDYAVFRYPSIEINGRTIRISRSVLDTWYNYQTGIIGVKNVWKILPILENEHLTKHSGDIKYRRTDWITTFTLPEVDHDIYEFDPYHPELRRARISGLEYPFSIRTENVYSDGRRTITRERVQIDPPEGMSRLKAPFEARVIYHSCCLIYHEGTHPLILELNTNRTVTHIETRGTCRDGGCYVTSYYLHVRMDHRRDWIGVGTFSGNNNITDNSFTDIYCYLPGRKRFRYFKITPKTWHRSPIMRVALIGPTNEHKSKPIDTVDYEVSRPLNNCYLSDRPRYIYSPRNRECRKGGRYQHIHDYLEMLDEYETCALDCFADDNDEYTIGDMGEDEDDGDDEDERKE